MSRAFDTTQWSVVLTAARYSEPGAREAFAALCSSYWPPLYAYARRTGHSREDAEDMTQEFFARMLERRTLHTVQRGRGRFRSFLLTAFRHFMADEHDRRRAARRGGQYFVVPLDAAAEETRLPPTLVDARTPEAVFERRWALAVLETALDRLREQYRAGGSVAVFDALSGTLVGEAPGTNYRTLAEPLGMSVGAVKVAAHRLRRRFAQALREQVSQTAEPDQIEDELEHLRSALAL